MLAFIIYSNRLFAFSNPIHLKCEYLTNPLGIDAANPRFSWKIDDTTNGARQIAFQIWVGTDSALTSRGMGNSWNSNKSYLDLQLLTYQGLKLNPCTKYYWKVRIWNQKGIPSKNEPVASFETGMMNSKNWQGAWISDTRDIDLKAAPYFRKTFNLNKSIVSARAYIAVAGLYELSVNGKRIGDHRLDPMYTRFDRRTLYVTHDITSSLVDGKNAVGVLLGNGWYNHQSTAVWYFDKAPWRGRPTFCMDIRIKYSDNTEEVILTGKEWKTSLSPITFNSIYTAEHYDARKEIIDWDTPNFIDTAWKEIMYRSAPSTNIIAQMMHPIRNVERVESKNIRKFTNHNFVFDLGRNISGVSQLKVKGKTGNMIKLIHSERLSDDGHADLSNINVHYRPIDDTDPFQTDIFILSGNGIETFMPRFNYKGFQYVEIISEHPIELTKESLTGYFMHSDVPAVGNVITSNITINKLWEATNNSYLSNLFGYPTDCPQREKNGWTGDAHIACETGLYNFDGFTVYEKWLADHRDEQQANGVLPSIIPSDGWGYEWGNGPDWTSTIAIIPWNLYLFYGDKKPLVDCYDNIKRYVDHITNIAPEGLTKWGLGDWVPVKSKAAVEFTSTAYYFLDTKILATTAKLLNNKEDNQYYSALSEKIKKAFNSKFLNTATGIYGSGYQTELSVPLHMGLVPNEFIAKVAANLANKVKADGNHIDVGLLGTKSILNALSENGYADIAYLLASQESYPSWGWWIKNGATTLFENWPIDAKSDISMNHIMFGEIGAWMYKALGGIKPDAEKPGFKNTFIEPHFVEGLDQFDCVYDSPYGKIESSWKKINSSILYNLTIPTNATATVKLSLKPGQEVFLNKQKQQIKTATIFNINLVSGKYKFEIQ